MLRTTATILIAAQLLATGCSSYARVDPTALNPKRDLLVELATPASVQVVKDADSASVEGVTRVQARFATMRGDTIVATNVRLKGIDLPRAGRGNITEARFVPRSSDVLRQSKFSAAYTAIGVLGTLAVLAVIIGGSCAQSSSYAGPC